MKPGIHVPVTAIPDYDFYFSFVRNPYDRIVSAYFYRQRGNARVPMQNYIPHFHKWLMEDTIRADMVVDEVFRPMVHYLDAPIDFIGRFENLQEDFDRVCKLIGLEPKRLIRDNVCDHPPWRELLDEAELARVYELYREDFESFGYERVTSVN